VAGIIHRGQIPTVHAQPNGTARARVFDIVIASRRKSMTITMAPDDDPRVVGLQIEADQRAGR